MKKVKCQILNLSLWMPGVPVLLVYLFRQILNIYDYATKSSNFLSTFQRH